MADYGGFQFDPYLMVVFMLVQEGADPHIKNRIGHGPLQICPSDVATLIRTFTQYRGLVTQCLPFTSVVRCEKSILNAQRNYHTKLL